MLCCLYHYSCILCVSYSFYEPFDFLARIMSMLILIIRSLKPIQKRITALTSAWQGSFGGWKGWTWTWRMERHAKYLKWLKRLIIAFAFYLVTHTNSNPIVKIVFCNKHSTSYQALYWDFYSTAAKSEVITQSITDPYIIPWFFLWWWQSQQMCVFE